MRRVLPLAVVIIAVFVILLRIPSALASSSQAYQDYQYQFDTYRSSYNEFKVAKNEYEKYKTLVSQTTALDKTKTMLQQRDKLLRTYLVFLNEKMSENLGLSSSECSLYQTLLQNEMTFLDNHSTLVPSVGSLGDAQTVSKQLESHYPILQVSIRQLIAALSLGDLDSFAAGYDTTTRQALEFINANRNVLSTQQQSTIDRWMLQIANKRTLYQQKADGVRSTSSQLKGTSPEELDRQFTKIQKDIGEAKQYLSEGSSFLGELVNALRYEN